MADLEQAARLGKSFYSGNEGAAPAAPQLGQLDGRAPSSGGGGIDDAIDAVTVIIAVRRTPQIAGQRFALRPSGARSRPLGIVIRKHHRPSSGDALRRRCPAAFDRSLLSNRSWMMNYVRSVSADPERRLAARHRALRQFAAPSDISDEQPFSCGQEAALWHSADKFPIKAQRRSSRPSSWRPTRTAAGRSLAPTVSVIVRPREMVPTIIAEDRRRGSAARRCLRPISASYRMTGGGGQPNRAAPCRCCGARGDDETTSSRPSICCWPCKTNRGPPDHKS